MDVYSHLLDEVEQKEKAVNVLENINGTQFNFAGTFYQFNNIEERWV